MTGTDSMTNDPTPEGEKTPPAPAPMTRGRRWLRRLRRLAIFGFAVWIAFGPIPDFLEEVKQGNIQLYPRALDLAYREWRGWYPIRVTLDLDIDGRPIQIIRDLQCHKNIVLSFSCSGCRSWAQNIRYAGHKLSTGGFLIADFLPVLCKPNTQKIINSGNFSPARHVSINWQDQLEKPRVFALYHLGTPSQSPEGMPQLDTENVRLSIYRPDWGKVNLTSPSKTLFGLSSPHFWKTESANSDWVLLGYSAQVIPEAVWRKKSFWARRLTRLKKLTQLGTVDDEDKGFEWGKGEQSEKAPDFGNPTRSRLVPLRKATDGKGQYMWTLDPTAFGVETAFAINGNIKKHSESPDNIEDEKVVYEGWEMPASEHRRRKLYDPRTRILFEFKKRLIR